jgi:hypothetical protein
VALQRHGIEALVQSNRSAERDCALIHSDLAGIALATSPIPQGTIWRPSIFSVRIGALLISPTDRFLDFLDLNQDGRWKKA